MRILILHSNDGMNDERYIPVHQIVHWHIERPPTGGTIVELSHGRKVCVRESPNTIANGILDLPEGCVGGPCEEDDK